MNNNNNFFNGENKLNNNFNPNTTPSTTMNNLDSIQRQTQINSGGSTVNNSNNTQFHNQNNLNNLSNSNIQGTNNSTQYNGYGSTQQSNISQQNNSFNTNQTPSTTMNNLNSIQRQTQINSGGSTVNNSNNTQFNNQNNLNNLSNSNIQGTNNSTQYNGYSSTQQSNISQQNNNLNYQNNNINSMQQQNMNYTTSTNDEELLKCFIGNNYNKITTRKFNFAGFFFSTGYMLYRKMFLYSILFFLINFIILNIVNNILITFVINLIIGIFVNKIYLCFAKRKINKIKLNNSQSDINQLKTICSAKGGTSVGQVILGLITQLSIALLIIIVMLIMGIGSFLINLFNPDNWDIKINGIEINNNENENNTNNSESTKDAILVEDITISGYSCFGSSCNISIGEVNNSTDYIFNANNSDLFTVLGDYSELIKVNIYYIQKENEKSIIDYKILLKSNNEDISNIKNEDELRTKLGLYSSGTHTDSLTLLEIGMTGVGFIDDTTYTYINYTFVDNKNNEYDMKYIYTDNPITLVEGNTYQITFEVIKDTFGYNFNIKSFN